MTQTTLIAAVLLGLAALAHLLRLILGLTVTVGGTPLPMWLSVIATVVAGGIALRLWRERRPK